MKPNIHSASATEGVDAYWLGRRPDECPYAVGSQEAADWLVGWQDAAGIDREQADSIVVPLPIRRN